MDNIEQFLEQHGKVMLANEQRREKVANKMTKQFKELAQYLSKVFTTWFNEYKDENNTVDITTAQKALTVSERATILQHLKRYERPNFFNGLSREQQLDYTNSYNKIVQKATENKLSCLESMIEIEILAFYTALNIKVDDTLTNEIEREYDYTRQITNAENLETPVETIKEKVVSDKDKSLLNQRTVLLATILLLVKTALIANKPRLQITKQMTKQVAKASAQFTSTLRSAIADSQIEAQRQSYHDCDIKRYCFVSETEMYKHVSLGGKSTTKGKNLTPCPICQGLNGQIFYVKNMKRGKNAPTMHPNCRCSTVPVID